MQRLRFDARDASLNINDEKINYLTALRLIQPNMDLPEPLSKEWVIGQPPAVDLQKSMSSTVSQFSKTGFPTNK